MTTAEGILTVEARPTRDRPAAFRALGAITRFARAKPLGAFGGVMLILIVVLGILSPVIAPYDLNQVKLLEALQGPSRDHWFGTDPNGGDLFSNILYGCQ